MGFKTIFMSDDIRRLVNYSICKHEDDCERKDYQSLSLGLALAYGASLSSMVYVGCVGIMDPIREDVAEVRAH